MTMVRALLLSCFCVLFASVAFADSIPVNNPSFETLPSGAPPLGTLCAGTGCSFDFASATVPIPGWNFTGVAGQFQPGNPGNSLYFNSLPDGPTVGFTNGGTISQTLAGATVQAGATYTLQVDLGDRSDLPFAGSAYLVIGGTDILATGTTPTSGNWSTYTATFTCADSCGQVGDTIGILLESSGPQGDFDNVRVSTVPEPAAVSMLALGLFALLAFGWRRKSPNVALG